MGDSYNEKPVPNVRVSDVLGILGFTAVGLLFAYIVVMWIFHLIVGR